MLNTHTQATTTTTKMTNFFCRLIWHVNKTKKSRLRLYILWNDDEIDIQNQNDFNLFVLFFLRQLKPTTTTMMMMIIFFSSKKKINVCKSI